MKLKINDRAALAIKNNTKRVEIRAKYGDGLIKEWGGKVKFKIWQRI